jgi:tetratricopeptide (TPR) repeat protein
MVRVALTYIINDNRDYPKFEKSLKSFTPYFDGLFVLINGLSGDHDKIIKLVNKHKGKIKIINEKTHPEVYHQKPDGTWRFQRFDLARQVIFDEVPDNYDYISWADYDDILFGGNEIRPMLEKAWANKVDVIFCDYLYKNLFNEKGEYVENLIPHIRERFIKPNTAFWKSDLHEVMLPFNDKTWRRDTYLYDPAKGRNLAWVHHEVMTHSDAKMQRNREILEVQVARENEQDPRTLFSLAKVYIEMSDEALWKEGLRLINKYLSLSDWADERAYACEYASKIYSLLGEYDNAITTLHMALKEDITMHTCYLKLAELYFHKNDLEKAKHCIKTYEGMPEMKSEGTVSNIGEAKLLYKNAKMHEAYREGKIDDAVKWAQERHDFLLLTEPGWKDDGVLKDMKQIQANETLAKAYLNVAQHHITNKDFEKLGLLVQACPKHLEKEKFMLDISRAFPPRDFGPKSIVYLASFFEEHVEEWNGNNLKTGIGGSETAVILLAEDWAKKGYDVWVFCDTPEDTIINGVKYVKYWKFNFGDKFDTLILWRTPFYLQKRPNARNFFLDLHDIVHEPIYTDTFLKQLDKVFFKSKAHRDQLKKLPDEKAVVISNGIIL